MKESQPVSLSRLRVPVPAGIPLTPTQQISLQHGDGKTSDVIVWPRPEAANFELARYMVRQRYLAGPDTPSAIGYRWPPGSRGAAKAPPSPPESHSPRRPSSPPVSSSPSYRTANLLDSTARVAQAVTKRDPYVAEPPSDLDGVLARATKARAASRFADSDALALVKRMAWPTNESAGKALELVQRLVITSTWLQAACAEAEQAASQAVYVHRAAEQTSAAVTKLKERALEELHAVDDQIWLREVRSMEQQHHMEMYSMRRALTAELHQQRSKAAVTEAELRNEVAKCIVAVVSLEQKLRDLQNEIECTTAEGYTGMERPEREVALTEASAQRGTSRVLDAQRAAQLSRAVHGSSDEMRNLRHALTVAEMGRDQLAEQCAKHEAAHAALTARFEDANARHVQDTTRLHHKFDLLRANMSGGSVGGAGTFNRLLRNPEKRSGRINGELHERDTSLTDSAIVGAELDQERRPERFETSTRPSTRRSSLLLAIDAKAADSRATADLRIHGDALLEAARRDTAAMAAARRDAADDDEEGEKQHKEAEPEETAGAPEAGVSAPRPARARPGTAPAERFEHGFETSQGSGRAGGTQTHSTRPVSARDPVSRSVTPVSDSVDSAPPQ